MNSPAGIAKNPISTTLQAHQDPKDHGPLEGQPAPVLKTACNTQVALVSTAHQPSTRRLCSRVPATLHARLSDPFRHRSSNAGVARFGDDFRAIVQLVVLCEGSGAILAGYMLSVICTSFLLGLVLNVGADGDFYVRNVLADGEEELRIRYRGITAKETSVGEG